MSEEGSVTAWIDQLRRGDQRAASPLWERYYARLIRLARRSLRGARRSAADEEDVVLSAFNSFCSAARAGRFPALLDRDGLWRLLLTLTERKAIDLRRHEAAAKRGGGLVVLATTLEQGAAAAEEGPLASLPSREPTPAFAALVADECQRLLRLLGDDQLRTLALLKLEGYTHEEIARRLECGVRTVERKLGIIRTWWERELQR
jgi:DNA-directed RNA polymerase specialized sigma24 family protein